MCRQMKITLLHDFYVSTHENHDFHFSAQENYASADNFHVSTNENHIIT